MVQTDWEDGMEVEKMPDISKSKCLRLESSVTVIAPKVCWLQTDGSQILFLHPFPCPFTMITQVGVGCKCKDEETFNKGHTIQYLLLNQTAMCERWLNLGVLSVNGKEKESSTISCYQSWLPLIQLPLSRLGLHSGSEELAG